MTTSDDPLERRLQRLRANYLRRLPATLRELSAFLAQHLDAPERQGEAGVKDPLRQAQLAAHKLYGTAGSYGYTTISERARQLEEAVATPILTAAARARLASAQDALTGAIADALAGLKEPTNA